MDNPFMKEDWTHNSLSTTWNIIQEIAQKEYGLTYYKPHFEVVNFEDMLHIYTGSLPIMYDHWSFGKDYIQLRKQYMADRLGVAYEVIFNSDPALCYLLEHNSPTMQGLVMAHAAIGHSAFFKNNYLFKEETDAKNIIPFLKNSKKFIADCEDKYGEKEVQLLLDACHSLAFYAIDRRPNINKSASQKEQERINRAINKDKDYDKSIDTIQLRNKTQSALSMSGLREENILKFLGKYSPALKAWQREIINIYCQIRQYLWPQVQTKVMNEGFASFIHYTIMNNLADKKLLESNNMLEFICSHCAVLNQPDFDSKYYSGFNPYKLGFSIFEDIKRICENPTEEDREWFPELIGEDWIEAVKYAAYNFKDSSFILQYLSPKVIRDLKLFCIHDNAETDYMEIKNIHNHEGYKEIRRQLSEHYDINANLPDVYISGWDAKKTRKLYLNFEERNGVQISDDSINKVGGYIQYLWPFKIKAKYIASNGEVETVDVEAP